MLQARRETTMNFILKRNNYFYFRIWIPLELRLHFKKKEICKSLKTDNYKNAKVMASKLLFTTERLFLHLRSGMYNDTQMKQLVKDYTLQVLFSVRWTSLHYLQHFYISSWYCVKWIFCILSDHPWASNIFLEKVQCQCNFTVTLGVCLLYIWNWRLQHRNLPLQE